MEQKKKIGISIILFLMSLIFLTAFSSASGSDWTQWRNIGQGSAGQGINPNGLGFINSSLIPTNMSQGINTETTAYWIEPIVMSINEPSSYDNKLIIPNGNYLQVYSSSLILDSEILTGSYSAGQIAVDSALSNKIHGIWRGNSTILSFRTYLFNSTSQIFSLSNESNLSADTNINSTGLSCIFTGGMNKCYASISEYNSTSTNYTYYLAEYANGVVTKTNIGQSRKKLLSIPTYKDWDNDGVIEALVYSTRDIFIVNIQTKALEKYYGVGSTDGANPDHIRYAIFSKTDSSPYGKLIISYDNVQEFGGAVISTNHFCRVIALKNDLTSQWGVYIAQHTGAFGGSIFCSNLVLSDYNDDNIIDIALLYINHFVTSTGGTLSIRNGNDGTELRSKAIAFSSSGANSGQTYNPFPYGVSLTGAELTSNVTGTQYDLLIQGSDEGTSANTGLNFQVYDYSNNSVIRSYVGKGVGSGNYGCSIADLLYDGYNDVICSRNGFTQVLGQPVGAIPNSAPTINSLAFSPSATITIGENLGVSVSATDPESDSILYIADCGNGVDFPEQASNSFSCTYSTAGTYTFTAHVRDAYHFTYNSFNYSILVTNVGGACNYNDVCEAGLGESVSNCPEDCTTGGGSSIGGENGTLEIPIQLVDTTQVYAIGQERGFLPSIYYGLLGFLSHSLAPIFLLVFVIFVVLIMFAIGTIVKKIFMKVSG